MEMPNWVKTIVKTEPKVLKDVLEKYSNKGEFSFNKVIPMPKALEIESGSRGEVGMMFLFLNSNDESYKSKINKTFHSLNMFHSDIFKDIRFSEIKDNFEKYKTDSNFAESIALGKKYIENYDKYGHATWYKWCNDNWGTKWDVSQFSHDEDTMIFETAWDFAEPDFIELSKKFPEATFLCKFADESIRENSGIMKIENGKIIEIEIGLTEKQIENIWETYIIDADYENDLEEEMEI